MGAARVSVLRGVTGRRKLQLADKEEMLRVDNDADSAD
jgi:hypothetical protein